MDNVNKTRFVVQQNHIGHREEQHRPEQTRDLARAPKLNVGERIKIAFQAAFKSIGTDKKASEIRKDLKADLIETKKEQIRDRAERRDNRINQSPNYKTQDVPDLKKIFVEGGEKPFLPLASALFKDHPIAFLSKMIDGFSDQARKDGATTHEEIRDLLKDAFKELGSSLSLLDLLNFDQERFEGFADQFRSEFRGDKADILLDMIEAISPNLEPETARELHNSDSRDYMQDCVDKQVSSQGKNTDFLRGNAYSPMGVVLHSLGLKDLTKFTYDLVGTLGKEEDIRSIAKEKNLASMKLQSADMTPKIVEKMANLTHKIFDAIADFKPSPELKKELDALCDPIRQAVSEGKMTKELGKKLIQQHYTNAVVLRVINPTLLNACTGDMTVARPQIMIVTQIVQNVANVAGTSKFQSPEAKQKYEELQPGIATKFNDLMKNSFGMDLNNVDQTTVMRDINQLLDGMIDELETPTELDLDELLETEPEKKPEPKQEDNVKLGRESVKILEVEDDGEVLFENDEPTEIPEFTQPDYDEKDPRFG